MSLRLFLPLLGYILALLGLDGISFTWNAQVDLSDLPLDVAAGSAFYRDGAFNEARILQSRQSAFRGPRVGACLLYTSPSPRD